MGINKKLRERGNLSLKGILPIIKFIFKWFSKRKILIYLPAAFVLFLLTIFIFRNPIIRKQADKKINSFNHKHHANLHIGNIKLKGLNAIDIREISLSGRNQDTLFKAARINVHLNLWKLLFKRISIRQLELSDTYIKIVRRDSLNNYSFLLEKTSKKEVKDTLKSPDYYTSISKLMNAVFDKVPSDMRIRNLNIRADLDSHIVSMYLPDFRIAGKQFISKLSVTEDQVVSHWTIESKINSSNRFLDFRLYSADTSKITIPYIRHKLNARVELDTARFLFSEKTLNQKVSFTGMGYLTGLLVNHKKISAEDVFFNKTRIFYQVNIGKDYFELDSLSTIGFNQLEFNPYIRLKMYPTRQLTLKINKRRFPAQELFESLPGGLFYNLDGIKTSGEISYHLDFFVDFKNPDSLKYEAELRQYNFRIKKFGRTAFTRINDSFMYTAYDYGVPVRSFMVGTQNPDYRTLEQISPYLKEAILTSEDGSFYYDRGFRADAIKRAIVVNIKQKRFVQGASTITMQLVKNVFLTRNKTIARKLEEMLITWLIEYNGLCTKDRMYEVYLNIIEWGPGVYGANEAAAFYFNKDASRISLNEAIFLAHIMPRPKAFMYMFDTDKHLRSYLEGYFNLLSELMFRKGVITEQEKDEVFPYVDLRGPAKDFLREPDSVKIDTTGEDDLF